MVLTQSPSGHDLRAGQGIAAFASEIERFLGRALAGTTEVLASSMPSGSNAGNGHVRIRGRYGGSIRYGVNSSN